MFAYYIQYVLPQRQHATSIYTYEIVILWVLCCKIMLASSADSLQAEAAAEQAPPPYQPYGKGKGKGQDLGFIFSHCLTSSTQRTEKINPSRECGRVIEILVFVFKSFEWFNGSKDMANMVVEVMVTDLRHSQAYQLVISRFQHPPTDTLSAACRLPSSTALSAAASSPKPIQKQGPQSKYQKMDLIKLQMQCHVLITLELNLMAVWAL